MTGSRYDLAVIGGGLMGLSVAFEARSRGMRVVILEAECIARHASSANAGGVRSLNRHPAEIPLARAALPLWERLSARLGRDCGFRRSGQIRVAEDAAAMQALERRAAQTAALGFAHERLLGKADLRDRIPAIAGHCRGALIVEDDGFADPLATSHAWRHANAAAGVTLRERTRVTGVTHAGSGVEVSTPEATVKAGSAVNTAGAWGNRLAASAGTVLPMRTAALQMTVTARVPAFVAPVVGTEGRKLSLKQMAAGSVVIGGGFEGDVIPGPDGPTHGRLRPHLAARNLANAVSLFPQLSAARVIRTWAGLEGMTPDGLPYLGCDAQIPDLVHAFGFSGHGFALSPLIGPIVLDLLEGRRGEFDLTRFSTARFPPASPTGRGSGAAAQQVA